MNPIVIVGILALAILTAIMMVSFSNDQVRQMHTTEKVSTIQVERLREEVSATTAKKGDHIQINNTGSIPIRLKEIRILDDNGHITYREKIDQHITASQSITLNTSPEIKEIITKRGVHP